MEEKKKDWSPLARENLQYTKSNRPPLVILDRDRFDALLERTSESMNDEEALVANTLQGREAIVGFSVPRTGFYKFPADYNLHLDVATEWFSFHTTVENRLGFEISFFRQCIVSPSLVQKKNMDLMDSQIWLARAVVYDYNEKSTVKTQANFLKLEQYTRLPNFLVKLKKGKYFMEIEGNKEDSTLFPFKISFEFPKVKGYIVIKNDHQENEKIVNERLGNTHNYIFPNTTVEKGTVEIESKKIVDLKNSDSWFYHAWVTGLTPEGYSDWIVSRGCVNLLELTTPPTPVKWSFFLLNLDSSKELIFSFSNKESVNKTLVLPGKIVMHDKEVPQHETVVLTTLKTCGRDCGTEWEMNFRGEKYFIQTFEGDNDLDFLYWRNIYKSPLSFFKNGKKMGKGWVEHYGTESEEKKVEDDLKRLFSPEKRPNSRIFLPTVLPFKTVIPTILFFTSIIICVAIIVLTVVLIVIENS